MSWPRSSVQTCPEIKTWSKDAKDKRKNMLKKSPAKTNTKHNQEKLRTRQQNVAKRSGKG